MHFFSKEKERFLTFFESLILKDTNDKDDKFIYKIKKYAETHDVPIITDECASLLSMIIKIKKPKNILELGTAIGYSTLVMLKSSNWESIIDTIENYPPRIKIANSNIKKYKNNIKLYDCDVDDFLQEKIDVFSNKYDMIFLDAAKAQYTIWISSLKKMLKSGGIIVADNILLDKDIYESRFTIRKRDRSMHKRMHDFLHKIFNDNDLESYIYDIGDGVSVSLKK